MKLRNEKFVIDNKECIGYISENTQYLLIQPVDEHDIEVLDILWQVYSVFGVRISQIHF